MKDSPVRFAAVDAFKAIASQLIVLHHLAAYGPLSNAVQAVAPQLISWLYDNVRMAVQVFIVIGGYLSARALFPGCGHFSGSLPTAITNRYLRLAIPYLAALLLSVASAALARHWMTDEFIPDPPTWSQALAHIFLLQGLLDYEALSAGAWYVAIDFQLFALMAAILWLGHKMHFVAQVSKYFIPMLVTALAGASLFWFNRNPELDVWAPYFFGAYGMGAATYWAGRHAYRNATWLGVMVVLAVIALLVDFRARIAVALVVTLLLWIAGRSTRIERWTSVGVLHYLGRISYALFLMHFPVLLLANALFAHLGYSSPIVGSVSMVAAWGASILVATVFCRWIEVPASTLKVQTLARYWTNTR